MFSIQSLPSLVGSNYFLPMLKKHANVYWYNLDALVAPPTVTRAHRTVNTEKEYCKTVSTNYEFEKVWRVYIQQVPGSGHWTVWTFQKSHHWNFYAGRGGVPKIYTVNIFDDDIWFVHTGGVTVSCHWEATYRRCTKMRLESNVYGFLSLTTRAECISENR